MTEDLRAKDSHFAFGDNWRAYSRLIDEEKIAKAVAGMSRLLPEGEVRGRRGRLGVLAALGHEGHHDEQHEHGDHPRQDEPSPSGLLARPERAVRAHRYSVLSSEAPSEIRLAKQSSGPMPWASHQPLAEPGSR